MFQCSTPILLLIFNRPDTTKKVFESIRSIRPQKLYIAADGPRRNKEGEVDLCNETRSIISLVDWDCDVQTLFREENLGCARAITGAIDWFFSFESEGIIIEDDCVPSPAFYEFCQTLLTKYRDEPKVMMISGYNQVSGEMNSDYDFHFSRWANIWGWATWKNRWELYDISFKGWPKYRNVFSKDTYFNSNPEFREWMMYEYDLNYTIQDSKAWSWAWTYALFSRDGLCVVPNKHLVNNVGDIGVHNNSTGSSPLLHIQTENLDVSKLKCPQEIYPDIESDNIRISNYMHSNKKVLFCLHCGMIIRKLGLFPGHIKLHPLYIGEKLYHKYVNFRKRAMKLS